MKPGLKNSRHPVLLLILFILCCISVFAGLGLGYKSFLTPRDNRGAFKLIGGDGWIEDGAEIVLRDLGGIGSRISFTFNPWRPAGLAAADIHVSVCGKKRASFIVTDKKHSYTVSLRGNCSPRIIKFKVLNPFRPSDKDPRKLGAQLESVAVGSRLGLPVVSFKLYVICLLAFLSLNFVYFFLLAKTKYLFLSFLVAPFAGGVLVHGAFTDWNSLWHLWLLFFVFGCGLIVSLKLCRREALDDTGSSSSFLSWLLLIVVLAGGALRFYGLDFGLPAHYHSDEPRKIAVISRMFQKNTWDPDYFLHPSLLLYSTIFINKCFSFFGITFPEGQSLYAAGRTVSAIAGTVSIYLLYLFGKTFFSSGTAVLAAAGLAFFPLHVTCSRYMKEDALVVCMLLLVLVLLSKAVKEDRKIFLYLAGVFAGVCASSKYSGLLSAVCVASAPWLRSRSLKPEKSYLLPVLWALALVPVGFLLCTPYAVLNFKEFAADFGSEKSHMLKGHTSMIDAWSQFWMYHFSRSLLPGVTVFSALVGVMGTALLLYRRRTEDLFTVGVLLMFYLPAEWVRAKPAPQPERYILPSLPLLALAAGEFINLIKYKQRRLLYCVFVFLFVVFPLNRSLELASELKSDTRIRMAQWMTENLPLGSKIYINGAGYAPQFFNGEFKTTHLSRTKPREFLLSRLKNSGQDYLIVSSLVYDRYFNQPGTDRYMRDRFREIFTRLPLVHEVKPLYGTYGFHNPVLRLYSLREQ